MLLLAVSRGSGRDMCYTGFGNAFAILPLAGTVAPSSPVALGAATTTSGRLVVAARYCCSCTTQHNTVGRSVGRSVGRLDG